MLRALVGISLLWLVTGCCSDRAQLLISNGPERHYGDVAVNTVKRNTFVVTNTTQHEARSMSGTVASAPFTYTGGVYPGTAGTCSLNLRGQGTCTLDVEFMPTARVLSTALITVNYDNGCEDARAERDIDGKGI